MGMSPSADLFYGYDLGNFTDADTYDDLRPEWMQEDEDPEKHLAKMLGWVEVPFPDSVKEIPYTVPHAERERIQAEQRATPEYRAWSDNLHERNIFVADAGVEHDTYGYGDEPSHCIRITASHQRASDYGSVALTPLEVDPAWDEQLAGYMRLMDFTVPEGVQPGWHMNCSYG